MKTINNKWLRFDNNDQDEKIKVKYNRNPSSISNNYIKAITSKAGQDYKHIRVLT